MPCTSSLRGGVLQNPTTTAGGKGMNGFSKQINNLSGQVLQQYWGQSAGLQVLQPTSGGHQPDLHRNSE